MRAILFRFDFEIELCSIYRINILCTLKYYHHKHTFSYQQPQTLDSILRQMSTIKMIQEADIICLWQHTQDLHTLKSEKVQHSGGHKILCLAEELLAFDSWWKRKSHFASKVWHLEYPPHLNASTIYRGVE